MIGTTRILLFPFAILYGCITLLRTSLFRWGVLKTFQPPIPTIVVGNLSMGGTGKTPHVEWLIRALQNQYKIAVLSRGYGRSTHGFIEVQLHSSADEVGDEPKQIKQKFPEVPFAVCEKRKVGIQELLKLYPDLELIILDDAMQHLAVSGGFVMMLSEFHKPFFKDWVVPMGRLREFAWSGKKRADVCMYTKCPKSIDAPLQDFYAKAFSSEKPSYFSRFVYGEWQALTNHSLPNEIKQVVLVTGIANPQPLVNALESQYSIELVRFSDHHLYSEKDIERIHHIFANFDASTTVVLTTEKDAVKLNEMSSIVNQNDVPWCYLPIEVTLDNEQELINRIQNYVESYPRSG
jgi:tetraacyldisaccharide 4'-kinase